MSAQAAEGISMEILEHAEEWSWHYSKWPKNEDLKDYPFIRNEAAPFTPLTRALPMLNLALISSAGGYIDGTTAFDTSAEDGDLTFREIPIEVEAADLKFAARGYDPAAVREDMNAQVPVQRLLEYQANGVIGALNPIWFSFCGHIPSAAKMADEMLAEFTTRVKRYEVQAALIIPASRLCHQSCALLARSLEASGISTIMPTVDRAVAEMARAPRIAYYTGEFGAVAGKPGCKQYQQRVLDESLRWIETFDQPGSRKLVVELETATEAARGER
ncbi:MAG TPA: glycine/sarcosine/betaine reductase selenoprotein B family protein [Pyrinomonadaceae bacterium]|jgi:D-proline reductase (dithiol) PrdB|nr:glycine/sarcosine/betaine reductase selenoprotein B family protein [Pyrinomonadaceae bacterium]